MNYLTVSSTIFKGEDMPVIFTPKKVENDFVVKNRAIDGTLLVQKIDIGSKISWTLSYPIIEQATYDDWIAYNLTTQAISSDLHDINGSYFIEISNPTNTSGNLLYGVTIELSIV